ncbi:hypothetical protein [Yoonia sp.]|jgi:hypothetical protein|uniref:hypothetical protein n=1 Tax=Yoonia sp. TaxID=2212373 RepID=UPI0025F86970|nr:hypothetical protein [Yoonia sp.]
MGFDLLLAGGTDNRLFSSDLLSCIVEVRVEQTLDQPTRFAVRFQDDIEDGRLKKAGLPELQIGQIVSITVDRGNDQYACLCRGVILDHETVMTRGGPGSTFTVLGPDRRDELARVVRDQNWSGRASEVAQLLLGNTYPVSDVQRTEEVYDLNGNALAQRSNDLEFLTKAGADHGYHFWVSYSAAREIPPANLAITETAHWKSSPQLQDSAPFGTPPVLPLAHDALTLRYNVPIADCPNLTKFDLTVDAERPTNVSTNAQNLTDGGTDPIDVTDQAAPMGGTGQGLAQRAPSRQMATRPRGTAQDMRRSNQAALRDAGFFVSAEISTTRHMLGGILEPHQVVAVAGIGGENARTPFRVARVTHVINGVNHFMDAKIETNVQLPPN